MAGTEVEPIPLAFKKTQNTARTLETKTFTTDTHFARLYVVLLFTASRPFWLFLLRCVEIIVTPYHHFAKHLPLKTELHGITL
jgi:hypothetical protein